MTNQPRRAHPLLVYFPTIVATAIAIGIGVYVIIQLVDSGESAPDSTISEYGARYLAKSAYSTLENNTVGAAVCDAIGYREDEDIWDIECRFDREAAREVTVWEVTPDLKATLIETRYESLN